MLYLLDANVLINANRDFYPVEAVPEFWEWIISKGESGDVKIPIEVYEELTGGTDGLSGWAKDRNTVTALQLTEEVDVALVQRVIREGYADDLTDSEAGRLGRDPFLIAHALKDHKERCVVTTEVSRPKKQGANRHIPNVCEAFGIQWCDAYHLFRTLGFKTSWKNS